MNRPLLLAGAAFCLALMPAAALANSANGSYPACNSGIKGEICTTADGLLKLPNGATTHGPDALVPDHNRIHLLPEGVHGTKADIACADFMHRQYFRVLLIRPTDRGSLPTAGTIDDIRQALYDGGLKMDLAANETSGGSVSVQPRFLCDGNGDIVVSVEVMAPITKYNTIQRFVKVVELMQKRGYSEKGVNYTSYYDGVLDEGTPFAGVGYLASDDRPLVRNHNNDGNAWSMTFNVGLDPTLPPELLAYYEKPNAAVFMHEMTHNMGGVSMHAPDRSGAGHCNDGLDVMCYADGGPFSVYTRTACDHMVYDCDADTYFNARPPFGSWLSTHWNIAESYNLYVDRSAVS